MKQPKLDVVDKILLAVSYALRFTLVLAIITAGLKKNWLTLFIAFSVLVLSFIPSLIQRSFKFYLPSEFEFVIIVFIYASLFLGEVHGYYTVFWWWDSLLHSFTGVSFGLIGFMMMYILHKENKIKTSPRLIAIFSFSFAVAIGSVWEIFEFSMDNIFGWNMQKSGLVDTMSDIIVNALGAFLTAFIGYLYIKGGKSPLIKRVVTRFVERNPHLFMKEEEFTLNEKQ